MARLICFILTIGLGPLALGTPINKITEIQDSSVTETILLKEFVGLNIFRDRNLSNPIGQACASCHSQAHGFADSHHNQATSEGALSGVFGSRNAPTIAYAKFAGPLREELDEEGQRLITGGFFLDGRAQSLQDQAQQPFLNPKEMNETKEGIAKKICLSSYSDLFKEVYGSTVCDNINSAENSEKVFSFVADALASLQQTSAFAPFTSKFDAVQDGKAQFTEQELRGLVVFTSEDKGNCAACHSLEQNNASERSLMTDFSYDNIGVPSLKNAANADLGLFETTQNEEDKGKFKVPTLRNITKTAPYMHNGYFDKLEDVLEFYSTRDLKPRCEQSKITAAEALAQNCWPAPDVIDNVNKVELGKLNLSNDEIQDLLAFLKTLEDGFKP